MKHAAVNSAVNKRVIGSKRGSGLIVSAASLAAATTTSQFEMEFSLHAAPLFTHLCSGCDE